MTKDIIAVDLGGTRIRVARMDEHLQMQERYETLTLAHEGLDATMGRIKQSVRHVLPKDVSHVDGIGISAPGPLNPVTGVIVSPPNLPGWHNVPLRDILEDEFGVRVFTGNDANVAALAETLLGAARGYRHVIYITHSTGVGGGIIVDGKMLLGKEGLGAEYGHIIMIVDGDRVSTLETEVAGPDMALQASRRIEAGEKSLIGEMVHGKLSEISGSIVGDAAVQGDRMALEIVRRSGRLMGLGIVTLLHLFNPEIVVMGGGVSKLGELIFEPMRTAIQQHCIDPAYWRDLKLVTAGLGDDVSLYGAAALVATDGGVADIQQALARLLD